MKKKQVNFAHASWDIESDDSDTEAIFDDLKDILDEYDNVVLEVAGEQIGTVKITDAKKKKWKKDFTQPFPKKAFLAEGRVRACRRYLHENYDVLFQRLKIGERSVGKKRKVTFSATTASMGSADKSAKAVEEAVAKVDKEAAREAEKEEREHATARAARRATEAKIKEDANLKSDGNVRKVIFV